MNDAGESAEGTNGEVKDRCRKVRKKPPRKESALELKSESGDARSDLPAVRDDGDSVFEDVACDGLRDACLEQFQEILQEALVNGDVAHSVSAFVTPRSSSSSDFTEFQFFDDLPLSPKEEEFKIVQRKKKNKSNRTSDEAPASAAEKRTSKLEECIEFIEKQVAGSIPETHLPDGRKSFCSLSNSVSVSTYESRCSSIRSDSPVNSISFDSTDKDDSLPALCEPVQRLTDIDILNDNCHVIPNISFCTSLAGDPNDTDKGDEMSKLALCDCPALEQAVGDGRYIYCTNNEQVSSGISELISDSGYPDIVRSTISEYPVCKSVQICRSSVIKKMTKVALPQPDDITAAGESFSSFLSKSGGARDEISERPDRSSEIVFGDFASSELQAQDSSHCDTRSSAVRTKFEFPMSYSRLRLSRQNPKPKPVAVGSSDHGICSNPVIFVNATAVAACDPEISFGFDYGEDAECDGGVYLGGITTRAACLPDLVDPGIVPHESRVSGSTVSAAATSNSSFEFCDAKDDSTSSGSGYLESALSACLNMGDAVHCSDSRLRKTSEPANRSTEKFGVLSKWNQDPDAWIKRNGGESYYDRRSGFRTNNDHAYSSHPVMPPSEKSQKKLQTINSRKNHLQGAFDLRAAQVFLWKSFEETLLQQD